MGLLLWIVSGLLAFGMARSLRSGGALPWPIELAISVAAALLLGFVATAFDFGGWKELEWRAGLFALLGSAALIALARVANLALEAVKKSRVARLAGATPPDARRADESMRGHRGGGATKQMATSRRRTGRSGFFHSLLVWQRRSRRR